jgi:hypothetical protein
VPSGRNHYRSNYHEGLRYAARDPAERRAAASERYPRQIAPAPYIRRAVKNLTGFKMSQYKRISYPMMAQWIKKIGEILGFKYSTIPYSLGYNAANGFDRSCSSHRTLSSSHKLTADSFTVDIRRHCGILLYPVKYYSNTYYNESCSSTLSRR